jgi:hypothetical protein
MIRSKAAVALTVLIVIVLTLASLRVHYVRDEGNGSLLWNDKEACAFIGVVEYGYNFSYLRWLGEGVKEIFPFGASTASDRHYYLEVLRITPQTIQRSSVDNFYLGSSPTAFGQNIYAGNLLDAHAGPTKWSGTHFEALSSKEQAELQNANNAGELPTSPSYNSIGGWSRRMVGGEVVRESPTVFVEKDARVAIELDGKPLILIMNSGFISHEARIDLARPGTASETIWRLNENSRKVSKGIYKQIFGSAAHTPLS